MICRFFNSLLFGTKTVGSGKIMFFQNLEDEKNFLAFFEKMLVEMLKRKERNGGKEVWKMRL